MKTFVSFFENEPTFSLFCRRHGCLVISLLAMMISTGLPELSSEQVKKLLRLNDTKIIFILIKRWTLWGAL